MVPGVCPGAVLGFLGRISCLGTGQNILAVLASKGVQDEPRGPQDPPEDGPRGSEEEPNKLPRRPR
eukprot:4255203-Pyramimonas_sp.AAC.1